MECIEEWKVLNGVKAFYGDVNTCVKVKEEVGESFKASGGVRQGCDITLADKCIV